MKLIMMMMIRDDGGSFDLHKLNKEAKYTHTQYTHAHTLYTHTNMSEQPKKNK